MLSNQICTIIYQGLRDTLNQRLRFDNFVAVKRKILFLNIVFTFVIVNFECKFRVYKSFSLIFAGCIESILTLNSFTVFLIFLTYCFNCSCLTQIFTMKCHMTIHSKCNFQVLYWGSRT